MQQELDFDSESIATQILLEAVKNSSNQAKKEVLNEYEKLL